MNMNKPPDETLKRGSTRKSSIFYIGRHLEIFDPLFFQLHSNARQKLGHRPKFYVFKLSPWRVMGTTFRVTPVMPEKIGDWFGFFVLILDFYQTL